MGAPRMAGRPLELIDAGGSRLFVAENGDAELVLSLRLTSYRSLPISCVRSIDLTFDGVAVAQQDMALVLDGQAHSLDSLSERIDRWWYILDYAELRTRLRRAPEPGEHRITVGMTTIVPFATGGRSTHSALQEIALSATDGRQS